MTPLGFAVFTIVVILCLGWFAVGTQVNVRKGNDTLKWLQEGLGLIGQKTTLRWLGSSVVELKIQDPRPPLRQVEVLVVLEPRDVPFLWWFFRARGRRDLLIFRSHLRTSPRFELEALEPGSWSARGILERVQGRDWTPIATAPQSALLAYAQGGGPAASAVVQLAVLHGPLPVRLFVHRDTPNLEAHWRLADLKGISSGSLFETLRNISERL